MNRYKRLLKALKYILITAIIIAASYAVVIACTLTINWCGVKYAEASQAVRDKLTTVQVVEKTTVLDPEKVPVEQLIDQLSADFGVNRLIVRAMALQESGGWSRVDRYRFEPKLLPLTKSIRGTDDEKKLWAGSWGLLQVIPIIHAKRCGLSSYSELIDPKTNIECGLTILTENLKRHSEIKSPAERLRLALRDYNGSGPDAENYSNAVMSRLANMLLLTLGDRI